MKISGVNIERLCEILTDYSNPVPQAQVELANRILFEDIDDGDEKGDIIMVFGSPTCTHHRSPKAAQLYFEQRGEYVILSGGKLSVNGKSEAENMWEQLRSLGVPNSSIILENESVYTHENVMFSSDIIRAMFASKPVTILAVTNEYHMRRVMLNFGHYLNMFSTGSRFIPVPCSSTNADRSLWSSSSKGRYIIARECLGLVTYVRAGYLEDIEI